MKRRDMVLGPLVLAASGAARATEPARLGQPREADWARLPPHPRLFTNAAGFTALKRRRDKASADIKAVLLSVVQDSLARPVVTYPATGMIFWPVREAQRRILALALAYRLDGGQALLDKARAEMLALAALPDWRPFHFLGASEAALVLSVGYDWLHDELTEDERAQIRQALVRNALLPSLQMEPGPKSWVNGNFNWTQVCHCGMVAAALVVAGHEPALARQIVERALANMDNVGASYGPDGSYPESLSYWTFGTGYHVLLVELLRSSFGRAFGLEEFPGFVQTADYALQMIGPTGQAFNYSDHWPEQFNQPIMLWFARERGDRGIAQAELVALARAAGRLRAGGAATAGNDGSLSRHLPFELLWWNPSLAPRAGGRPRHWSARGGLPMAVLRSAWDGPRASFVAIKGGSPNHSHAHMDVGSFVLEADGVRWAIDSGIENYDKLRAAKIDLWNYAQDSSRWSIWRVSAEGHNILRFDDAPQRVDGHASLTRLPPRDGVPEYRIELASLYRGQAVEVQRDVALHADRSIELTDRWTVAERPVQARWQWLTHAEVTPVAGGLLLRQAGQALRLRVETDGAAGAWTAEVQDVSAARAPQDSPNPGLRRIVLTVPGAAGATVQLRMRASPGAA